MPLALMLMTANMRRMTMLMALMVSFVLTVGAAIDDIKFSRLDTRDGLSNSQILCVKRDSKGFVWIGTPYGLNRYDGYRIKTFYSYAKDTTTLRNNYVDEIYEAYDGKLWLKQGMNYTIFDPVTESCDRHPERWLQQHGVTGGIERLYIDKHHHFWVKTYETGFWHYNPYTKEAKQFKFGYGRQDFNSDFGVSGFAEIGKSLLVSSFNGEVFCFNREKNWISWKDAYIREKGLINNQECKLRTDADGNLWMITVEGCFVKSKGRWVLSYKELAKRWGVELPDGLSIWDICSDSKKRVWIATDHTGLFLVDRQAHEVRQFLTQKNDGTSISENTLRFLYRDQQGRIWIGTYMNGVNMFKEGLSNFRHFDLGNITTITSDKSFFWLGTNDAGIIRMDRKTGEQAVFDRNNSGIATNTMVSSLVSRDGTVWFGTYEGGLIRFRGGAITNFRSSGKPGELANNNIWSICEDRQGNIWIGTLGSGVQRITRAGRFDTPITTHNSILASDYISTVSLTKKNWLMVSHSNFYSIVNPVSGKIINRNIMDNKEGIGITESSICTMEDSRGLAWQGSSSGATIWDTKTNAVYLIDMRSGLLGSTVNAMVEDNNHTVWLVTDHGVSNVIPQQKDGRWNFIIRTFNSNDGLQNGPFNQRAICKTADGLILVGGQEGLDVINPKLMREEKYKEYPVFSGLKLFEQDVKVGEKIDGRIILRKALNICRAVRLKYNDQFTIQLGSSNGEIHHRSRFLYRLDGVNNDWIRTEEANPNITYMSLPSGSYTLRVRMLNADGTIGSEEATLTIIIQPPFWRSWWMVMMLLLVAAFGIWWWRKNYMRRQAKRQAAIALRLEMEKRQWMAEMKASMAAEQPATGDAVVEEPVRHLMMHTEYADLVAVIKKQCAEYVKGNKGVKISNVMLIDELFMEFDVNLIKRMLNILFTNSQKFATKNCHISVGLIRKDNGNVQIQVADNGIGVADEYKPHIFDHTAGVDELELALVKDIIVAHGGTIEVKDNPGGGTIMVIDLPAKGMVEEAEIMDDDHADDEIK